ncbi:prophage transcriptional regulator [Salinisphaera hydrothermalis C27AD]
MGVHKNTLARYEDGDTSINADFIAKLAERGYNAQWILTGEGESDLARNQGTQHADMVRATVGGSEAAQARREARTGALAKWSSDLQARLDAILGEPQLGLSQAQHELLKAELHEVMRQGTASEFVEVPLYDVEAAAGHGSLVTNEEVRGRYAFRRDFVRSQGWRPEDLALITGRGDSMPGVIDDGQLVLVNLAQTDISGEGIYVLRLEGHLVIKAVQRDHKGNVYIRSTNQIYREIVVPREELHELQIIGRAVWTDRLL